MNHETTKIRNPLRVFVLSWLFCGFCGPVVHAQQTTRVNVLQAEDRRAPTPRDLATIRAGARSGDPQTARVGVRALGRLERPALIPDRMLLEPLTRTLR